MTNAEFIKSKLTDADIACMMQFGVIFDCNRTKLIKKAYDTWKKWAESASDNHGNMAKGIHGTTVIKQDPSVWNFEKWKYPDGTWKHSGRTESVSMQVWLSMQYNEKEWQ